MIRRTLNALLSAALVMFILSTEASTAFAQENAWGQAFDGVNATYAAIEGADPAIRDGGWSYMRPGGQRYIGPDIFYIEIGWLKTAANPQLTSYWTYRDVNGFVDQGYGGVQGCCVGYNYQVLNVGSGFWNVYVNDLSTPLTTKWTGFDYTDNYLSGGEVSSSANAMGVSGNINVAYLRGGVWYPASDWQPFITNPIYTVVGVINPESWQVYGNN